MISGISTLFQLLYGCSSSESCLSRQIKKRVRVDPGGGEAGLLWEDQRLHPPLALSAFPEAPLTQVISQLRSIDTHSWSRNNVSCLQLSFITRHTLPASFHHLLSRMVGLLNTSTGRDQKLPPPPSVLWGITESRTGRRSAFQKEQSSFGGVRKVTCSPLLSFLS